MIERDNKNIRGIQEGEEERRRRRRRRRRNLVDGSKTKKMND